MKNFITTFTLISLSSLFFYCTHSLTPQTVSTAEFLAGNSSAQAAKIKPVVSSKKSTVNHFSWEPVKAAVIPFDKGIKLNAPFTLVEAQKGDITWVAGNGYAALNPLNVKFYSLGSININKVTLKQLDSLDFNANSIAASPVSSVLHPNRLPPNTIIACKTREGNYFLLEITKVGWGSYWNVQFSVYQAVYELV